MLDQVGIKTLLEGADERFPRLRHPWLDAGYRGEDEGANWVEKTLGWSVDLVERPRKLVPEEVLMRWAAEWAKEGVSRGSAETVAPQRLFGAAEEVGGRADDRLDRPEQEDEQRPRAALCERRGVRVRCHDSPHDEAARPRLRAFHTASMKPLGRSEWAHLWGPTSQQNGAGRAPTADLRYQRTRDSEPPSYSLNSFFTLVGE